jgi:type IV pilus assembly protein PilO
MADLKQTRRKLKTVLIVMLAIDVIAAIILLSPLVGSSTSRQEELQQARVEARQKTREVEPLRGMDKKVVLAGQEIDSFYKDRLPTRESEIAGQFGKLASDTGVKLGQVKYDTKELNDVGLAPVYIDANCQGDYKQLVRFINALERDKIFFIINSVVLGDAQGGSVKLQIKVETYLRMT